MAAEKRTPTLGVGIEPEMRMHCSNEAVLRDHVRFCDLLLTLESFLMVIIEVKKYSADTADTAKQAGYHNWLELQNSFCQRRGFLLTTDAGEEKYENFSALRWGDVCIRLRRLLPKLRTNIGLVKTAMIVAFISAVETNLLNFVVPPTESVQRLFYARTIEHLEKYLGDDIV